MKYRYSKEQNNVLKVYTGRNNRLHWNFSGGPLFKTQWLSICRGHGLVPGWGAKIPHAAQCIAKKREREIQEQCEIIIFRDRQGGAFAPPSFLYSGIVTDL